MFVQFSNITSIVCIRVDVRLVFQESWEDEEEEKKDEEKKDVPPPATKPKKKISEKIAEKEVTFLIFSICARPSNQVGDSVVGKLVSMPVKALLYNSEACKMFLKLH